MYGKLMSISDELMWRYWMLLTDLRASEIAAMQDEVREGSLHPMQAKKNLAWTITKGFHSEAEANVAAEGWAARVQKGVATDDIEIKKTNEGNEKVFPDFSRVLEHQISKLENEPSGFSIIASQPGITEDLVDEEMGKTTKVLNVVGLILFCGLAESNADARRKINARAVSIEGHKVLTPFIHLPTKFPIILKVGRHMVRVYKA
jgi:tyrosyl-tRNA synthetase